MADRDDPKDAKRKRSAKQGAKRSAKQSAKRPRPIPDPDTVESEGTLQSPSGRAYRVIRTTQRDEYEE